jgi:hypothetical protein
MHTVHNSHRNVTFLSLGAPIQHENCFLHFLVRRIDKTSGFSHSLTVRSPFPVRKNESSPRGYIRPHGGYSTSADFVEMTHAGFAKQPVPHENNEFNSLITTKIPSFGFRADG